MRYPFILPVRVLFLLLALVGPVEEPAPALAALLGAAGAEELGTDAALGTAGAEEVVTVVGSGAGTLGVDGLAAGVLFAGA